MRRGFVVGSILLGCGQSPPAPTEAEARAALEERKDRVSRIEEVVRASIREAALDQPRPDCATGDGECLAKLRAREGAIKESQKKLAGALQGSDIACADIAVSTPKVGEELVWRVATCPPGRRGDSVAPKDGVSVGDVRLGWGVYFKRDQRMRRGVSVERTFEDGEATAQIEVFFFLD